MRENCGSFFGGERGDNSSSSSSSISGSCGSPLSPGGGGRKRNRLNRTPTFSTMQHIKRFYKENQKPSIQKPHIEKIMKGLAVLLCYLLVEPPESMLKNYSWDIFSAPGDRNQHIKKISKRERMERAGSSIISYKVVEKYFGELYRICQWTNENHIIAFLLMIRVIDSSAGKIMLHRYNWQCLLLISLMVSQKIWDDVSLNNVDFPQVWKMVAPNGTAMDVKDVNFMEREYLRIINFNVSVGPRLYSSVYFEVMAAAEITGKHEEELEHAKEQEETKIIEDEEVGDSKYTKKQSPHFYFVEKKPKAVDFADEPSSGGSTTNNTSADEGDLTAGGKYNLARRNTVEVLHRTSPMM